jgi:hypothetical protein
MIGRRSGRNTGILLPWEGYEESYSGVIAGKLPEEHIGDTILLDMNTLRDHYFWIVQRWGCIMDRYFFPQTKQRAVL